MASYECVKCKTDLTDLVNATLAEQPGKVFRYEVSAGQEEVYVVCTECGKPNTFWA